MSYAISASTVFDGDSFLVDHSAIIENENIVALIPTPELPDDMECRKLTRGILAPGFIDTDMTRELPEEVRDSILARIPQGRMGRADEIADVVAYLATRASYINGTVIHVNGGMFGG